MRMRKQIVYYSYSFSIHKRTDSEIRTSVIHTLYNDARTYSGWLARLRKLIIIRDTLKSTERLLRHSNIYLSLADVTNWKGKIHHLAKPQQGLCHVTLILFISIYSDLSRTHRRYHFEQLLRGKCRIVIYSMFSFDSL